MSKKLFVIIPALYKCGMFSGLIIVCHFIVIFGVCYNDPVKVWTSTYVPRGVAVLVHTYNCIRCSSVVHTFTYVKPLLLEVCHV